MACSVPPSGPQLVVDGMQPRTYGRALRRVRSRIANATATAMPCSTPTSATVNRVMRASPNSKRS